MENTALRVVTIKVPYGIDVIHAQHLSAAAHGDEARFGIALAAIQDIDSLFAGISAKCLIA